MVRLLLPRRRPLGLFVRVPTRVPAGVVREPVPKAGVPEPRAASAVPKAPASQPSAGSGASSAAGLHTLRRLTDGTTLLPDSSFVVPAGQQAEDAYYEYPEYDTFALALERSAGPPLLRPLSSRRHRHLYAVYTPEEEAGPFFANWWTILGVLPNGAEGKRFPDSAQGEKAARQWLQDHHHPTAAVRALRCPDA